MGEKIARGSGPESTKYDRDRHAKMQLRDQKYGNIKVFQNPRELNVCVKCSKEIFSHELLIAGRSYHGECFRCEL